MFWCDVCRTFIFKDEQYHKCPTGYRIWQPDCDEEIEDGCVIRCLDLHDAVETWAEKNDVRHGDYIILSGSPAIVHVCSEKEYMDNNVTTITEICVEGETQAVYSARTIKEIDNVVC